MQFKSELAKQVFQAKYMRKEHKTPDDALESLARAVGSIWPELYEETKEYVGKLWFLPGGSVWRAAGNPNRNVSYVNCTTLEPPEDNLESIFDRMYKWAKCAAFGQGNGLDISNLRPAGSVLKNSAVTSTGAVSMAPMYNAVLSVIAQQGRRGASLISIKINHPDVEKFITAKADSKALETANISIQVTDDFMVAVRDNLEYELTFTSPYETITKKINARELFRKIAEQAWKSAEPGLQFFETARKMSNSDALGYPIVSTNACGEQYLDSYNVCNLSHINLAKFDEYGVEGYKRLIKFGIKFINATRMLELREHRSPLQEQAHKQSILPRSGLGVTGLADYFIKKKLEYGSDESIEETKWLFSTLAHYSYLTSYELGKEYGSFPTYDKKRIKESQFIQNMLAEGVIEDWMLDHQFNVCLNTVAPVGTGTLISDTSGSGIEPIFSLFMVRKERATTGDWKEWFIFSPIVKEYLQERNYPETPDSLKYLKESYWSTSYTVDPMKKLKLMSVVQHYIDSSISITFNLPKTATVDDVYNIYYKAWEYGLKGITVYREGSRDGVLVTEANYKEKIHAISTDTRPRDVPCDIYFTKHKGKEFLILVGIVNGSPYEVFLTPIMGEIDHSYSKGIITKIKSGHYELCVQNGTRKILIDNIGAIFDPAYASLSRLVSVSLQHGASLDKIIAQLSKDGDLGAFQKVISRVLKQYVPDNTVSKTACPVCGAPLVYEGGCMICKSCGNSKCD